MTATDTYEFNPLVLEFLKIENGALWPRIFQQIRQESTKKEYSLEEAKKADNKFLNRYRDVNPYDHSRVILSKDGYTYINASYINVEEARRKYILTQGPLPNTICHFWLMVWEKNSKTIIMLNKLIETSQSRCSQYWPTTSDVPVELPQVDLKVELTQERDFSHYIVRNIRLTNTSTDETRDIIQFHYSTWPDFGVPQSPLAFLKFLRDIRQCGTFRSEYGPPIVHCSAGIGRSGTFCLVDSCLVLMNEKGVENVNVRNVLLEMRTYRMGLIQTHDQLRFSYIAIIQGLRVDWDSTDDEGLPNDDIVPNGASGQISSDSDEEAPPLPPPRSRPDRPLPDLPNGSPAESETDTESNSVTSGNSSDMDNEETRLIEDPSSEETVAPIKDAKLNEPILSSVPESRKRKHPETNEKSKRISEKVTEMKRKQQEAEKWKKQRSLLANLTIGLSFMAMSGAVIAYLWYRK